MAKKVKTGSVEIMGYIGIIIWAAVYFLRSFPITDNDTFLFLVGILPNLGAAWVATMLGKWLVLLKLKKKITIKIHLVICAAIFIFAFLSEIFHDSFLNSPFDTNDIIITAVAQLLMFFIPILTKDKYFSDYN